MTSAEVHAADAAKTRIVTYYRSNSTTPAKTETITGLALSSIYVKVDEWRQWTGGTARVEDITEEQPAIDDTAVDAAHAPLIDAKGHEHRVTIDENHHDAWTGAGELKATCLCGWWDHHPYLAGSRPFAHWKLHCRAIDHVPELRVTATRTTAV